MHKKIKDPIDFMDFINEFGGDSKYKCNYLIKMIESGFEETSAIQTKHLFVNLKQLETDFGKDVYDFTQGELEISLKSLFVPKINALQSLKSSLDKYLLTALADKKSIFSVSPTINIKRKKLLELTFKDAEIKRLCTEKELYSALNRVENYQDKLVLVCLWKGLYNSEYQMMRDMKTSDIDFENNTISTVNKSTGEVIITKFTDYEMMILKIAIQEGTYTNPVKDSKKPEFQYMNSMYVFKIYDRFNNMSDVKIRAVTFRAKIRRFQKDTGLMFLNSQTINVSGWIFKLLEEEGYDKKYSHKDIIYFINKYDLKLSYINFYSNVEILQEKYKVERDLSRELEIKLENELKSEPIH